MSSIHFGQLPFALHIFIQRHYHEPITLDEKAAVFNKLLCYGVAAQVGYANANYFNKVFRKVVAVSAGMFRESKEVVGIDRLIID